MEFNGVSRLELQDGDILVLKWASYPDTTFLFEQMEKRGIKIEVWYLLPGEDVSILRADHGHVSS